MGKLMIGDWVFVSNDEYWVYEVLAIVDDKYYLSDGQYYNPIQLKKYEKRIVETPQFKIGDKVSSDFYEYHFNTMGDRWNGEVVAYCYMPRIPDYQRHRIKYGVRLDETGEIEWTLDLWKQLYPTKLMQKEAELLYVPKADTYNPIGLKFLSFVENKNKEVKAPRFKVGEHVQFTESYFHITAMELNGGWTYRLNGDLHVSEDNLLRFPQKQIKKPKLVPKLKVGDCVRQEGSITDYVIYAIWFNSYGIFYKAVTLDGMRTPEITCAEDDLVAGKMETIELLLDINKPNMLGRIGDSSVTISPMWVLVGDTKPIKDTITAKGGKFCGHFGNLDIAAGWIFDNEETAKKLIQQNSSKDLKLIQIGVIHGDTKPIKDEIKIKGGVFNKYLPKVGAGWMFPWINKDLFARYATKSTHKPTSALLIRELELIKG